MYAGMCMLVNVCWNAERGMCGYGKSQADCACVPDDPFAVQGPGTPFLEIAFAPTRVVFPWDNLETPHTHQ